MKTPAVLLYWDWKYISDSAEKAYESIKWIFRFYVGCKIILQAKKEIQKMEKSNYWTNCVHCFQQYSLFHRGRPMILRFRLSLLKEPCEILTCLIQEIKLLCHHKNSKTEQISFHSFRSTATHNNYAGWFSSFIPFFFFLPICST